MMVAKFKKSNLAGPGPTYKCRACYKLTRETGEGESGCELCAFCFLESSLKNERNDYPDEMTAEKFAAEIRKLEARYKRLSAEDPEVTP